MKKAIGVSIAALAVSLTAAPQTVFAQGAPAQSDGAQDGSARTSGGLEEIIVTARKRAEPLQEVPVSVSAFGGEALKSANVDSVGGLQGLVPGMTITQSGASLGTPQLSLRGISIQDVVPSTESGVGFTIDGIPLAYQRGMFLDSFDIERIEVLRGPQGLLFGKNTTGGTVNVIRSRPDPNAEIAGRARVTFGSFGRNDYEAVVTAPVVPGLLAIKGAISVKKNDGPFKNIVTGEREGKRNFRDYVLSLVATPSERTNVYLSFERIEDDSQVPPYVPILTSTVYPLGAPGYFGGGNSPCVNPTTSNLCVPLTTDRNGVETRQFPAFQHTTSATLEVSQELTDGIRAVSLTGYRKYKQSQIGDFDGTRYGFFRDNAQDEGRQISQELRAETTSKGPLSLVAGAFYIDYRYNELQNPSLDIAAVNPAVPVGTTYLNSASRYLTKQNARSFALFFQADYKFFDRLTLTVGARQTWDRKKQDYTLWAGVLSSFRDIEAVGPLVGNAKGEAKFKEFTPKVGLQFEFNPNFRVYGSYTKGYNTGGFGGRPGDLAAAIIPYQPETMDAYEIGFKSELFDRRVRFNASAFYNTMDNKQEDVLTFVQDENGARNVTRTVNAARARYKGVEVELAVIPVPGWTISSSAGYLSAKYKSYTANLGQGEVDLTSLKLRRTPKWTGGFNSDYVFDVGEGKAGLNATFAYVSRYETNVLNDPRGSITPTGILDLSARYSFPVVGSLNLEVSAFVKNVTDNTTYTGSTSGNAVGTFLEFAIPRVGRTWGTSLSARF